MCLIVVKPNSVGLPKKSWLKNGFDLNPHGVGIAHLPAQGKMIHIKKDFDTFTQFWNYIETEVGKDDILVIHFRLATSGKVDKGNRHPFPVSKNLSFLRRTDVYCRVAAAHNGVLQQFSRDSKFSDTQLFISEILAHIKDKLDNPGIRKLVSHFLGNDRLVVLFRDGRIELFGEWIEDGGCYWSNDGYRLRVYRAGSYYPDEPFVAECDFCGKIREVYPLFSGQVFVCHRCLKEWNSEAYWEEWDT